MASNMIKILFLAANPDGTERLRLDQEVRAIDRALREGKHRDRFDLLQHSAVTVDDLPALLLRHQPDIVHFSGHGSNQGAIFLEPGSGRSDHECEEDVEDQSAPSGRPGYVSARSLSRTFEILKDNVRCVVLNACYSDVQARGISEHVDVVIGMSRAISDKAAINFASAFYLGLGFGRDVRTAFELGCNAIDLMRLPEQDTPKLVASRMSPRDLILLSAPASSDVTRPRRDRFLEAEGPIRVFYSYAHEDEELRNKLESHLKLLRRRGIIAGWHDREMTAGADWQGAVSEHLERANLILLLVSADFLASDYIYDVELTRALERQGAGEVRVIPILLRDVDWSDAPFAHLLALPRDARPVTSAAWHTVDDAFADVARGIRRVVEEMERS